MVYGILITIVTGDYKPTYNYGDFPWQTVKKRW